MKIKINRLKLFGYHGVYNKEREDGQHFEINAVFEVVRSDKKDDKIESAVNYVDLMNKLVSIFNSKRYNLMESIIDDMFFSIFSNKKIKSGEISIKKTNPPINLDFESIEIEDRRKNG